MRTMPTVTYFRVSHEFRIQISTLARRAGREVRDGLTAGLNNPPLMRKKTHAFTASENPKLKLIYSNSEGFFCATWVMTVVPVLVLEEIFATLQSSRSH